VTLQVINSSTSCFLHDYFPTASRKEEGLKSWQMREHWD
jgi:hypothetical protein